jgi:hypothetical protein
MVDGFRARLVRVLVRLRRLERREVRDLRRWLEHTSNLLHASILVFVPALIWLVTYLSNQVGSAAFLIFPPLASGTYTLFANPEGKYASPVQFVSGLTIGALAGWVALEVTARFWYHQPPGDFQVHAGAAALGIFLTGAATWALDVEEPSAFATALLVLLFAGRRTLDLAGVILSYGAVYVVGVAVTSTLVAVVFAAWRDLFYEQRARYLYETTRGDDHVLVPMRGEHAETASMFGARIAAAHDAGKVVLLDVVADEAVAAAEQAALERLVGVDTAAVERSPRPGEPDGVPIDTGSDPGDGATAGSAGETTGRETVAEPREAAGREGAAESVRRLERQASRIETKAGVPCDVVVAADGEDPAKVVSRTAVETNCDLIVVPYEERRGRLSPFVAALFGGDIDVVAFRADGDPREEWDRVLVPVRRAGDQAHAMIDFALRLAGRAGHVAVCTCIDGEADRRRAETMLAQLVETFAGRFVTRVANAEVPDFDERNGPHYDLTVVGASTDRSKASRFLSRPTFERLRDVDCDVAIVHRAR